MKYDLQASVTVYNYSTGAANRTTYGMWQAEVMKPELSEALFSDCLAFLLLI